MASFSQTVYCASVRARGCLPVSKVAPLVGSACTDTCSRSFSSSKPQLKKDGYKLVIAGGGCGGMAVASMFNRKLGPGNVAVIEPKEAHYYQPMWTLVGAGHKPYSNSYKPQLSVTPNGVDWIQDKVAEFDPDKGHVITDSGDKINYDYLVVAVGLQLDYHKIKGATEALKNDPSVCSNYSPEYVLKTHPAMTNFKGGNALFTYPNSPIKCAGAPQKIMYLFDDYLRTNNRRTDAHIHYITSLPAIFGIKKYAECLMKIVNERDLKLTTRSHLIDVDSDSKVAVFENLDTKELTTHKYNFLHITPPMSTPEALRSSALVDPATGFLTVTRETMQHTKYSNVFGIGDNCNTPNAKTAAAVAGQTGAVQANLWAVMQNQLTGDKPYDGYASCPLITAKGRCILAEFNWDGEPMETFPIDQGRESALMYGMKAHMMPQLYWNFLIKGTWRGPGAFRKVLNLKPFS